MNDRSENVMKWFLYYIEHFSNIDYRELKEHSLRVKDLGWNISGRNGGMKFRKVSSIIGLLHDIGRFRRVDSNLDYAELTINRIKESRILEYNFDFIDCEKMYEAIYYHNKINYSGNNFYAKIIRDIDKLDNYFIIIKEFKDKKGNEFSDNIIEKAINCEQIDFSLIKTEGDKCLVYLMWIYDINYKEVLKQIRDKGYIDILYGYLPEDNKFIDIMDSINNYILNKTREELWTDE